MQPPIKRPRPPWCPPELDPELVPLAEAESAARSAVDHAMVKPTPAHELARLNAVWEAANDRLADAIIAARSKNGETT